MTGGSFGCIFCLFFTGVRRYIRNTQIKDAVLIQNKVEQIVSPFKEEQKEENFVPHITIGRVKDFNKNINLDLSTFSNAVYSDIKIPVKTIYLLKSQLLDTGVEYSIISKYSLK